jgi:hypothetical protein
MEEEQRQQQQCTNGGAASKGQGHAVVTCEESAAGDSLVSNSPLHGSNHSFVEDYPQFHRSGTFVYSQA